MSNKNENGHKGFWNPVKIFIRLVQGVWTKRDKVSGETYPTLFLTLLLNCQQEDKFTDLGFSHTNSKIFRLFENQI